MKSNRPKLDIPWGVLDWLIEILGAGAICLMLALTTYYFGILPDTIPTHFNSAGEVDGYSSKSNLWILTGVALLTYFGIFILNKYPHLFNYLHEITERNARTQYLLATRMMRFLNMEMAAFMCFLQYYIIQSAQGVQVGNFLYAVFSFLAVLLITMCVYFYSTNKTT